MTVIVINIGPSHDFFHLDDHTRQAFGTSGALNKPLNVFYFIILVIGSIFFFLFCVCVPKSLKVTMCALFLFPAYFIFKL